MKKFLLSFAAAALCLAACDKPENQQQQQDTPELSATPTEVADVPAAGKTFTVQVTANTKWAANTANDWITLENNSGEGNGSFTVIVKENAAYKERSGVVSVNSTAKRVSINVKQEAAEVPADTKLLEIKTAEDFVSFAEAMDAYETTDVVKLAADITVTAPVDELTCIFDGQGHTITFNFVDKTGYTADDPVEAGTAAGALASNVGLFRKVRTQVRNLKTAGSITSSTPDNGDFTYHIGGIAGYAYATASFENCTNGISLLATAFNTQHMGGIAGYTEAGVAIKDCTNKGSVDMTYAGSSKASQLGGIVGHVEGVANLVSCTNDGEITYTGGGTARMGGVVGYVNNVTSALFKDCINNGAVKNDASGYSSNKWVYVGGITGYYGTPIAGCQVLYDGCVNNGTITSDSAETKIRTRLGGIAGIAGNADGKFEYKNCTNNGALIQTRGTNSAALAQLAGIVAYAETAATVVVDGCVCNAPITMDNVAAEKVGVGGIIGGGGKGDTSTFSNVTVTDKAVFTFVDGTYAGLIGGYNEPYTCTITGKVAGAFVASGNTSAITADNYKSKLFGRALGSGANTDGVIFGN